MTAKMIDRVETQGKLGKFSASNVSYYCLQYLKSGRPASGCSLADAPGTQAQLNLGASTDHPALVPRCPQSMNSTGSLEAQGSGESAH